MGCASLFNLLFQPRHGVGLQVVWPLMSSPRLCLSLHLYVTLRLPSNLAALLPTVPPALGACEQRVGPILRDPSSCKDSSWD